MRNMHFMKEVKLKEAKLKEANLKEAKLKEAKLKEVKHKEVMHIMKPTRLASGFCIISLNFAIIVLRY